MIKIFSIMLAISFPILDGIKWESFILSVVVLVLGFLLSGFVNSMLEPTKDNGDSGPGGPTHIG